MKKSLIILGNILIILAVLAAVFLDVSSEQQWRMETKREDFENMTAAMESVTANYLLGEQQVCNAWARYINASDLTAEEAIAFLGKSVNRPQVMAHILYEEDGELVGLSTEAHKKDPGDYTVSYKNIDILEDENGMLMSEDSVVKVTRAYTNPVNAIQSIAFCCISTGVFRFPPEQAAEIAVHTVKEYLKQGTSIRRVIFNVFKDSDLEIYRKLLA